MNTPRITLKYVVYYVLIMIAISIFGPSTNKTLLINLCQVGIAVSMFAGVVQMLLSGSGAGIAQRVSDWCLRGTIIVTGLAVIAGIGFDSVKRIVGF